MVQLFPPKTRRPATTAHRYDLAKPITVGRIFNLPAEILGVIFDYCLPPKKGGLLFPIAREAPLLLCMVCSHWRRVATSMPTLWSTFSTEPPRMNDKASYIPLMELFLDLSRPCTLTFDIEVSNPKQQVLVKQIFPKLLYESKRWHDVALKLDETLCQQFLNAPLERCSTLEALSIDTSLCTDDQTRQIPAALHKFPRLCRLKIPRSSRISLLELPWVQLTDVYLNTPITLNECIDAFQSCPRMVNCVLSCIIAPNKAVNPHTITLPALTNLDIQSACDVGEILSHLTCPALTHLSIYHTMWDTTRDPNAFSEFCDRSYCGLRTFRFIDEWATECDLLRYISTPALRSLESLELSSIGASVETLTMFLHNKGATRDVFMPLLETLKLDAEGVPDNLFSDVVASRFISGPTAKTISRPVSLKRVDPKFRCRDHELSLDDIHALREEHASDMRRFEEFKTKGLIVLIRVGDRW